MKSGVEQPQYWLLQETGESPLRVVSPLVLHTYTFFTLSSLLLVCAGVSGQMKVSGGGWVLANLNVSGYYRVNYDSNNWERLLSLLNNNHKVQGDTCGHRDSWGDNQAPQRLMGECLTPLRLSPR